MLHFDKIESFVQSIFQNKGGSVSRQEILNRSQQSQLGSKEKNLFNDLPDKSYNKEDLMSTLKSIMEKRGVSKTGSMFKKAA
jgi:anthranilate/para-aminobenzoate synthase component II